MGSPHLQAYDNGLEFVRRAASANAEDVQARLARERAEWQRQAEQRHQERMRVLQEEIRASQRRYRENCTQAELRYQDRMKAVAEQLRMTREAERATEVEKPEGAYTLADEMLSDLRRRCPEWEIRRQKVLRVSLSADFCLCARLTDGVRAATGREAEERRGR